MIARTPQGLAVSLLPSRQNQPSWVVNASNPPDLMFDFTRNLAWRKANTTTVLASGLLTCSRASVGYVNSSAGVWSAVLANLPRISDLGLLVEEARTNSLRNNSMTGAAAGAPGTPPTGGWSVPAGPSGLVRSIVGVGTENGIDYIDLRFAGTTIDALGTSVTFESATQIPATYGQTWASSLFCTLAGGSTANIAFNHAITMRDSGGSQLGTSSQVFVPAVGTLSQARSTIFSTLSNVATAFIRNQINFAYASGVAIDITLRIGWPQLENNNINSTVASAVKAADGTGGVDGTAVYTLSGGAGTQATLNVTWAGGVMTVNSVASAGSYTTLPPSPATLAYVSGVATGWTGATVTLTPTNNAASAFATSPIRTTGAAATRSTDVVSAALSGYTNAASIYGKGTPQAPTAAAAVQTIAEFNDGSANNRLNLRSNLSSAQPRGLSVSANVTTTLAGAGTLSQGVSAKLAAATMQNDQAFSVNGAAVVTSAAGNAPIGLTTLNFGNIASGSQSWNGFVEGVGAWNSRVPNAQLVSTST